MERKIQFLKVTRMFALLVVIAFMLRLPEIAPLSAFGQTRSNLEGEASGTISVSDGVNTRAIKLKYSYASSSDFYFTDRPLPEDPWLWSQYIEVMARDGKLNALHVFSTEHNKTKQREVTQGVNVVLYCGACECKDELGSWKLIDGNGEAYGQLDARIVDQRIVGKVHADKFQENCLGGKELLVEYEVGFKTKPAPAVVGEMVSDGVDKPGGVYSQFYRTVMEEDAKAAKRLVASEHTSFFEGTNAQKNVARLKSLIKPFSRAWMTTLYMGDRYAGLELEEDQPGIAPRPKEIVKTQWYSPSKPNAAAPPPPPPPPPPPAARPAVVAVSGTKGKAHRIPKPPVLATMVNFAKALMVLERGEWKIDWWMFFDADGYNLLSSLETYKTRAEAEKEREEKYWRIADTTPLPAVGGEAGRAYLAFCQSERAGNKIAMLKYLTGEQHDVYASPELYD